MKQIRIVLVDDHELIREGTHRILDRDHNLKVVGEGGDGQQALELIERFQPDVVILDIRMPGLNGIEVVKRMRERFPDTKALILTAYDDDDYILALMEAGASGYILKTAPASELIDAVERIYSGEIVLHPAITVKVARLWSSRQNWAAQGRLPALTVRERDVLHLAAKGYRNKTIADELSISVRTVEGYFTSILSKLGASSRVEAVLYAISQQGFNTGEKD